MASQQQKKDQGRETADNGGKGQDPVQQLLQIIAAVCCVGVGTADGSVMTAKGGCFPIGFLLVFCFPFDEWSITQQKSNKTD